MEGRIVKQVQHKTRVAFQNRVKITKIVENSEDKDCITSVKKTFVYVLTRVTDDTQALPEPQTRIRKSFDTKTRDEKFSFRIKGSIYVNHSRRLVKSIIVIHFVSICDGKQKFSSPKVGDNRLVK